MDQFYWRIADGRVWGLTEAAWLAAEKVPDGFEIINLTDSGRQAALDCLRAAIVFYGGRLGELATAADRRKEIIIKYEPLFEEMKSALMAAKMQEPPDDEDIADIKAEYRELQKAMRDEITALS